jgi:hypothetical protein
MMIPGRIEHCSLRLDEVVPTTESCCGAWKTHVDSVAAKHRSNAYYSLKDRIITALLSNSFVDSLALQSHPTSPLLLIHNKQPPSPRAPDSMATDADPSTAENALCRELSGAKNTNAEGEVTADGRSVLEKKGWLFGCLLSEHLQPRKGQMLTVRVLFDATFDPYGGAYFGCCAAGDEWKLLREYGPNNTSAVTPSDRASGALPCPLAWRGTFDAVLGNTSHAVAVKKGDEASSILDCVRGPGLRIDSGSTVEIRLDFRAIDETAGGRLFVTSDLELVQQRNERQRREEAAKLSGETHTAEVDDDELGNCVATGIPSDARLYVGVHSATATVLTCSLVGSGALVKSARKS